MAHGFPEDAGLDDELRQALADDEEAQHAAVDFDHLFTDVSKDLQGERGPRAWLRSRPTWLRWSIGGLTATLMLVLAVVAAPRPDWSDYPIWRMVTVFTLFALGMSVAIRWALRPLHQPALTKKWIWGATLLVGLGIPVLIALLPWGDHAHHHDVIHNDSWEFAMSCLTGGLLFTLPWVGLIWYLGRGLQTASYRLLLVAAGGGVLGNLLLESRCHVISVGHILKGHVSVAAVLIFTAVMATAAHQRVR